MLSRATSKYVRVSPYKLRPIADVIRGLSVDRALSWLKTHSIKRMRPITKTLLSAIANVKNAKTDNAVPVDSLIIKEIRIDQGPSISYIKPGAMGRASSQQKRMSHVEIVLDQKVSKKLNEKKADKELDEKANEKLDQKFDNKKQIKKVITKNKAKAIKQ